MLVNCNYWEALKHCIALIILLNSSTGLAQPVFVAGASGNLYRFELSNCKAQNLGKTAVFVDLAMDPTSNELYGINWAGLHKIDTVTANTTLIGKTIDANALTFDRNGTLYAASGGSIYTIDKSNGTYKHLGYGSTFTSAGDLTFFQGELYLTSVNNELVKMDLDNIKNSKHMGEIDGVISGEFLGVTAVGCKNIYGFANNDVYEIRPDNLRKAHMKCPLIVNDVVFGAASYQESGFPDFQLGEDSFLCDGDTLKFSFDDSSAVYTWQDNLIAHNYSITTSGTYWVHTESAGCSFKDTVNITFGSVPQVELGPDTTLCPTNRLRLQAHWPGGTYLWQDSSKAPEFEVHEPGLHWVVVKVRHCGSDSDSVFIKFKDKLNPELGPDRYMCNNEPIVLRSNLNTHTIEWQDGSDADSFIVRMPGTYWLKGVEENCAYVDTLHVLGHGTSPNIDLGRDTALCYGDSLVLNARTSADYFQWSTNSSKRSITVDSSALYWLIAKSDHCGSDTDSVQVTVYPNLSPGFSGDTVLCDDDTLVLDVDIPGAHVSWQDSIDTTSFLVTRPGNFRVTIRFEHCQQKDSIRVLYEHSPIFDLGPDTVLCEDSLYNLQINVAGAEYLWSNGSQLPTTQATTSGNYWATASSSHCGLHTDTVTITFVNPSLPSLGPDTSVCEDDGFFLTFPAEYDSIFWSNGSQAARVSPKVSAEHYAQVYRQGCRFITDTIAVVVHDCNCPVNITNIFSPNGDTYNDRFGPTHQCYFTFYHFQIFNRWGQCVFESNDPEEHWKGIEGGGPGVFMYLLHYQFLDKRDHKRAGTVTVVR